MVPKPGLVYCLVAAKTRNPEVAIPASQAIKPFHFPLGGGSAAGCAVQDSVLSLRLAAFGGLGVVAGLMVQNSMEGGGPWGS